ncbi:cobalamin biosynthesis protein CbiB [Oxobacter pfennigii]|uniref:Cobalamin biosynthesis protein CobD n=1 Tax=Oxobacter pfennigii TaxID=36849 RepID=A0A0N8NTP4_9CLOT|nr:adenosylcobinamide-phosphate synthase CbiB [Oxobacter pfennigii]KPU45400.1 cobalamin biosynthesis protein CbiB [Oxobacter pfennigii]
MIELSIAALIDVAIGDPYSFPHPIKLMGNIIAFEEKAARKVAKTPQALKVAGFIIVVLNILMAYFIPYFILNAIKGYKIIYFIVNTYFLYTCIAAGCLHREAMKIYRALLNNVEDARHKLSYIVGRDTKNLDEHEIVRATVETVAENASDGVIAPILFAAIGGAPLAFAYKMTNTMDSMLGYLNETYRHIGFFPAKTDDVFNFIPARLTGVLMCLSSFFRFKVMDGLRIMVRDRKNHKSPNCAYPEGATAGLLGVQLGGDNVYFGEVMKKPRIGDKLRELNKDDIKRTIEIMYRAEALLLIIYYILIGVL